MHLFIVSETTLPIHLKYLFAGVTKKNDCSWNNINVNASSERAQAGLFADICRVHKGDEILFYLEKTESDTSREGGRFFGIFEIVSENPIYEPAGEYLNELLGMPLVYRQLIKAKKVYKTGLTEWQAMDEMSDFKSVYDIPWSIIYRKMIAQRGCTPLLPHEGNIIKKMLDLINAGQTLNSQYIDFDTESIRLKENSQINNYSGNKNNFDKIDNHLMKLMDENERKWELQLQAYLMQEIGRNIKLSNYLFPNVEITWIGNEIYAGAGMQSIDILIYTKNELNKFIHLIELKSVEAGSEAASQLNRYIKWLKAHIPDISVHEIIPTIIAPSAHNDFHHEMRTYLRGHGINQYRVVTVNHNLEFNQDIITF